MASAKMYGNAPPNIDMVYEFRGMIAGNPSIARDTIKRSYVQN